MDRSASIRVAPEPCRSGDIELSTHTNAEKAATYCLRHYPSPATPASSERRRKPGCSAACRPPAARAPTVNAASATNDRNAALCGSAPNRARALRRRSPAALARASRGLGSGPGPARTAVPPLGQALASGSGKRGTARASRGHSSAPPRLGQPRPDSGRPWPRGSDTRPRLGGPGLGQRDPARQALTLDLKLRHGPPASPAGESYDLPARTCAHPPADSSSSALS